MNNKFYVPDISEFYVGFEFEEEFKQLNRVRVKYLDSEDLNELGFMDDKTQEYDRKYLYRYVGVFDSKRKNHSFKQKVYIDHMIKDSAIGDRRTVIYEYMSNPFGVEETKHTLFIGYINNKSELKKLLSMLRIG